MIEDFAALGVLATIVGVFIYCQAPRHWQNLTGFLIIVFGWMPLAILGLCVIKEPVLLIPTVFIIGCVTVSRRRA